MEEDTHDRRDDESDETHEHECAEAGEIAFGGKAVDAHRAEHQCGRCERLHDRCLCVDEEDRAERQTVQQRVDEEHRRCRGRREAAQAG